GDGDGREDGGRGAGACPVLLPHVRERAEPRGHPRRDRPRSRGNLGRGSPRGSGGGRFHPVGHAASAGSCGYIGYVAQENLPVIPETLAQQARYDRVIAAATVILSAGGQEAVQMKDLAQRAQVSLSTL